MSDLSTDEVTGRAHDLVYQVAYAFYDSPYILLLKLLVQLVVWVLILHTQNANGLSCPVGPRMSPATLPSMLIMTDPGRARKASLRCSTSHPTKYVDTWEHCTSTAW